MVEVKWIAAPKSADAIGQCEGFIAFTKNNNDLFWCGTSNSWRESSGEWHTITRRAG